MDAAKSTSSYDWLFKHRFCRLFRGFDYSDLHKVASLVQCTRFSTNGLSKNSVSGNFSPASLFLAVVLVFILMISFAILIWIASGKNPMDTSLLAEVYVDIFAAIILITGGGICFYGLRLLFNLRKVRSEQVSAEMRKVSGLAGVSVGCFTISSLIAFLTHIPLFYHWNPSKLHGIKALVLLIIYYFIGSTVPLAFVLWVLRELPPENIVSRQEEPRRITYVNRETVAREPPQQWASTTVSKNQVSKASPI